MKIRKKQGSIDSLKIGFFGYNTTGENYSFVVEDDELSSEWQCFRWKHTTTSSGGWKFLEITYTAANGVVLLFDDIKVYKSNDANKTPVAFQNGLPADATFDTSISHAKTYEIIDFNNTVDPNVEFTPISSIPCRTNNAKMLSAPTLTALGEGVKGSYAMQIGTMETASNTVYFQASGTSIIESSTEYVVEMKIRKKQGSIDSLKIGFFGYNTTGENYSFVVEDDELSSEWQCFRWKHTTTSSGGWKFLEITYTAANGVVLLFDDIKVYKSNDANKTPVAFQNGLAADATFDTFISHAKNYELVEFDNAVDPNVVFTPVGSIPCRTNNAKMLSAPTLTALGEGVKGSYAMQIGTMETTSNTVYFQPAGTSIIESSTEYVVEMKIRKKQGSIDSLKIGFFGYNTTGENYSFVVEDDELSSEWQCFRWKHTTTSSGGWKFLEITYTAANGVILQFDDIKVYKASDTNKTPLAFQDGLAADATFDTLVSYAKNYEIIDFDNSVDANVEFISIDEIPHRTNNEKMHSAPVLTTLGEGVKGSYAMQIGAMDVTDNAVRFQTATRTAIEHDTEYVIEMKIKRKAGSFEALKVGFHESGIGSEHSFTIENSVLSDEWQCFRWKHKTNANDGNWKFFEIAYYAPEGVIIQIDDIKIYRADDEEKTLVPFQDGLDADATFDTSISYVKTYEIIDFDNTVDPNVEFTPVGSIPCRTNNDKMLSAPVISQEGEGVRGSYAMQIGTMETTSNTVYFQPAGTSIIESSTEYVVEMKVRKKQGNIKALKMGFFGFNTTGANYSFVVSDDDISSEWQCFRWKHTTTSSDGWKFFEITYTAPNGVILLFDDIKIYKSADAQKTPIAFQNGLPANATFDTTMVYGDNYELVEFDNSVIQDVEYKAFDFIPHRTSNEDMHSAPVISSAGEGVRGTYAMQIGAMDVTSNAVRFQASSRTTIEYNTEYVIEMKIKRKAGSVKSLNIGFHESGIGSEYSLTIPDSVLSNEWQCFRWKHTTNENTANWKFFEIAYYAPEGAIIQIDDIKIYRADDKEKKLIPFQDGMDANATFETERIPFTATPVASKADTETKYVPVDFYNWENVNETSVTDEFPSGYIFKNDSRNTVRPRLSALGEGFNGSYAMVVGGKDVTVSNQYQVRFAFPASNVLAADTEYTFKVKLKRIQGAVDSFKIGFIESGSTAHYSLDILNSELSDEWTEYTWNYTTDNSCSGATVWNYVVVSYVATGNEGATVLVDDLVIYPTKYGEGSKIFGMGAFEYKDLGQEKVEFADTNPTDCVPAFRKSTANDKNGGLAPRVVECNAHSGKYALALGFNENPTDSAYTVSLLPTKPGGTYRISFWVKVQGKVDGAYIGFMDSFQKYKFYGGNYSFNQYEYGKWRKVEFTYTDTATISTARGYRYFIARLQAPANSGILIDDVSITDVSLGQKAVNLIEFGKFEKDLTPLPEVVWDDRYIHKEENSSGN